MRAELEAGRSRGLEFGQWDRAQINATHEDDFRYRRSGPLRLENVIQYLGFARDDAGTRGHQSPGRQQPYGRGPEMHRGSGEQMALRSVAEQERDDVAVMYTDGGQAARNPLDPHRIARPGEVRVTRQRRLVRGIPYCELKRLANGSRRRECLLDRH
jgi:hypothetical protein